MDMMVTIESKITDNVGQQENTKETYNCLYGKRETDRIINYMRNEASVVIKIPKERKDCGNKIKIRTTGEVRNEINVEEGRTCRVAYNTGYGIIDMLTVGQVVDYEMTDSGGYIKLKYEMRTENAELINNIEMKIEVKE